MLARVSDVKESVRMIEVYQVVSSSVPSAMVYMDFRALSQ